MNHANNHLSTVIFRHACFLMMLTFLTLLPGCGHEPGQQPSSNDPLGQANHATLNHEKGQATPPRIQTDYELRHAAYYTGSCDGSGAVALDNDHFVVVNDETSQLLVYARHTPDAPLQKVTLHKSLDLKKGEEADLEGVARIGQRIYVLGSHSRDRDGKKEKERRKLLAVHVQFESGRLQLTPIGKAYEDLMDDLMDHAEFKALDLKASTKKPGDDPDGFNIEGLCAGQNGSLWLCFRGPRVNEKAIMIPLINPEDVIAGARARFGDHVLLDLGGRSIRGADNIQGQIVLIAESDLKGVSPAIYLWEESHPTAMALTLPGLETFDPESIIIYPDTGLQELQILSDDGGRRLLNEDCKDEENPSLKRFRSATYSWRNH